ncbi:MAG: ketosteroid isomerase-like protein [Arenicella sp.]|jgi:ketosteroid isomerase-like protein
MKKRLIFLAILFLVTIESTKANNLNYNNHINIETQKDSIRLVKLDRYWDAYVQAVKEGDFEGLKSLYHNDAVLVKAASVVKTSIPIDMALAEWKEGIDNTKKGKQIDEVEFRFSQRIGNETTAHETGIFMFTTMDNDSKVKVKYLVHFEMLMIKESSGWHALMEHQKSNATEEEWDALN